MYPKSILVVAVASCVLALGAGQAWAAHEYEAPHSPGTFGGEQGSVQTFKLGTLTLTCLKAEFGGSQPSRAITVEEEVKNYKECEMLGKAVTATVTECAYQFGEPFGGGPLKAVFSIKNHTVKCEMTFSVGTPCSVAFKAQSNREIVEPANVSSASMKITFNVKGLEYTHTGTGCTGIGTGLDGSYEGVENIENLIVT